MKSFLAGLGAGVALGVLFAPRTGEETRQQLRSKAGNMRDAALQQAEKLKNVSGHLREQAGDLGRRAAEQLQKTTSQMKDAAQEFSATDGAPLLRMLNTASQEKLMELRGIGVVLASRIIESRPLDSIDQVVERGLLSRTLLEELTRELNAA